MTRSCIRLCPIPIRSTSSCIRYFVVGIVVGMTLVKRPPKRKPRGQHPLNALTPAFVRNVNQAGRYCDGQGLYLDVRPTGSRGWI